MQTILGATIATIISRIFYQWNYFLVSNFSFLSIFYFPKPKNIKSY